MCLGAFSYPLRRKPPGPRNCQTWLGSHAAAFAFLGGFAGDRGVPDNLAAALVEQEATAYGRTIPTPATGPGAEQYARGGWCRAAGRKPRRTRPKARGCVQVG